jgi:hypothetical protein
VLPGCFGPVEAGGFADLVVRNPTWLNEAGLLQHTHGATRLAQSGRENGPHIPRGDRFAQKLANGGVREAATLPDRRAEVSEERDVGRDQRAARHYLRKSGACWWRDGLRYGTAVTHERDTGRGLLAQIDLLDLSRSTFGGVLPMGGEGQMDVGVDELVSEQEHTRHLNADTRSRSGTGPTGN